MPYFGLSLPLAYLAIALIVTYDPAVTHLTIPFGGECHLGVVGTLLDCILHRPAVVDFMPMHLAVSTVSGICSIGMTFANRLTICTLAKSIA